MTTAATIQLKMIEAMIAAIDMDDAKDADQAIRLIKALLGDAEK